MNNIFRCIHCFKDSNAEQWNVATANAFEDIKPVEKIKGAKKSHPYGEKGFLFICPKCNMTNESQLVEKIY